LPHISTGFWLPQLALIHFRGNAPDPKTVAGDTIKETDISFSGAMKKQEQEKQPQRK